MEAQSSTPQTQRLSSKEADAAQSTLDGTREPSIRTPGDVARGLETANASQPHTGNIRRLMALVALDCMWTNAQAPLYLFAGVPAYIYGDLGGADYWVWFITSHLLAVAAISPFVGALSDLVGRRYVALAGNALVLLGQVVCGTARGMDMFIAGMAITGVGSGINELTALAGTAELVPVSRRGYYVAGMIMTILPFLPAAMYAQLIAAYSSWRYIAVLTSVWTFIGLVLTSLFYFPPARVDQAYSDSKIEFLKRTDFFGGVLSIAGISAIELGILGGGYEREWASAHILAPLTVGFSLMTAFAAWERWGTKTPMIPRKLSKAPRTLALTMLIAFVSGANFFAVLSLWPSEAYNVYGHDPIGTGVRGLPFAFGSFAGCVISLFLLSWFRGNIRWLLFGSSVLMTAGCGSLAAARVDNIQTVYAILFIAGLGVGGLTVPVTTISTVICPGNVIATVTALTITIRIIGGAVGYAVYYSVFVNKLVPQLETVVGAACVRAGIEDPYVIGQVIKLTGRSMIQEIRGLPGVDERIWAELVAAGQEAFSNAYPWAYYCSAAFGALSILASLFMEDISEMMDNSVVVVM